MWPGEVSTDQTTTNTLSKSDNNVSRFAYYIILKSNLICPTAICINYYSFMVQMFVQIISSDMNAHVN